MITLLQRQWKASRFGNDLEIPMILITLKKHSTTPIFMIFYGDSLPATLFTTKPIVLIIEPTYAHLLILNRLRVTFLVITDINTSDFTRSSELNG